MFIFLKKYLCLVSLTALTACTSSESAFVHPNFYYPEMTSTLNEKAATPRVVVFGQSFASNELGMGTFIEAPKSYGKYYQVLFSSTTDIPSFYLDCKTSGNYQSGFSHVRIMAPKRNYELGKYYQASCQKIDIKHYISVVKEADEKTYMQEMSGGIKQKTPIEQYKSGKKGDSESVHFYAKPSDDWQKSRTELIVPFRQTLKLAGNVGKDLHLKGDVSMIQVNCIFQQAGGSSLVNVSGDFKAGHSYEVACVLNSDLTAQVISKELNN